MSFQLKYCLITSHQAAGQTCPLGSREIFPKLSIMGAISARLGKLPPQLHGRCTVSSAALLRPPRCRRIAAAWREAAHFSTASSGFLEFRGEKARGSQKWRKFFCTSFPGGASTGDKRPDTSELTWSAADVEREELPKRARQPVKKNRVVEEA